MPALALAHGALGLGNDASSVVAIVACLATAVLLARTWKARPDLEAIPVAPDDPLMAEQIARSRAELHRLFEGLEQARLETFVKFPMPVGEGVEHVWGVAHARAGDAIVVSLASTPMGRLEQDMLDRRQVPIDQVEDWMLVDSSGQAQGGYTHLALARIYQRDYGRLPRSKRALLAHFRDFSLGDA